MHLQLEAADDKTIRAYSDTEITVGSLIFEQSIIIGREAIETNWPVHSLQDLNERLIDPILKLDPEVIIIGHGGKALSIPIDILQYLSKKRIGIECMSIGAASRTFNVLLNEGRRVVLGIIFENH